VYERALLQKANFPKSAIPMSIILSNFFHLLVSFGLLLLFLVITGKFPFPHIILIIPALIWLLTFTIGFSLLSSSLQVKYRDINFFVQSLLILMFYATPILYSLSLIPSYLQPAFAVNPLTTIFELFHYTILRQGTINVQILIINAIITCALLVQGILVYNKESKNFVDWL
jgi:lipopolysaccharide transport system permease protein